MVMWYKNGPFHYSLCKWMMLRIEDQYIQFSPSRNPVVFCYTEALKFLFGMIISLLEFEFASQYGLFIISNAA